MDDITSRAPVTVRYWAGAAAAAGRDAEELRALTVGELRRAVLQRHPDMAAVLGRCSILVQGSRRDDEARLAPGDEVEILPPFAGG